MVRLQNPEDVLCSVTEWVDFSCGNLPAQHCRIYAFQGKTVSLYLKWRGCDPWMGYVMFGNLLLHDMWAVSSQDTVWSPNLLPTQPPKVQQSRTFLSLLKCLTSPQEPCLTKEELSRAKKFLEEKANMWLRSNG